ncbi:hypothetical protein SprV_0902688700 [Sparganum proliferum]
MHLRSLRWQLLDHLRVRRRDQQNMLATKAICGANEALSATRQEVASNQLTQQIKDLPAPDENAPVETRWCQLRDAVYSTALTFIGCARRQQQDWFDYDDTVNNSLFGGNQRRPGSLILPPRDYPRCITTLQRESTRIRCDPICNLQAQWQPTDGPTAATISGDVTLWTSSSGPQGRNHCSPLRAQRQPASLRKSQGISLLNITGKIFVRILLDCLNRHLEQGLLSESQCGFRRHRVTIDRVFANRRLQNKCQEMRTHIYTTFVNLTRTLSTVNRERLWRAIQKFVYPEGFTPMVRQLHEGIVESVEDNGAISGAFLVTEGVEQGCALAPAHFSLAFSASLMDAYRDRHHGMRFDYRTSGHLLNSRRMKTITRLSPIHVGDLRLDDDCTLNMHALPTHIPRANRPPRTPSKAMHQQSDNVNFSFHSHPCGTPATTTTPSPTCAVAPLSSVADIIRSDPRSASITATTVVRTAASLTPATDAAMSVVHSSATITTSTSTSGDVDSVQTRPHWDHTLTPHIGLVGHLRIHCAETGELVPGISTYTRCIRLSCSHCPRYSFTACAFTKTCS